MKSFSATGKISSLTRHERIFIAPDTDWDEMEISNELDQLGERLGLGTGLVELLNGNKRQN
jgi:hypothetical protein